VKTAITIVVDTDSLSGYDDRYIAQLWHVAQANPAPLGDRDACDLAGALGAEIMRRWLAKAPVELYTHMPSHFEWKGLQDVGAKFIDGRWQIPAADAGTAP
jgi:hypothetical protein